MRPAAGRKTEVSGSFSSFRNKIAYKGTKKSDGIKTELRTVG
jgi:hypothetical protein